MIQWLHDERCAVALDTGYQPALISTWYGQASCRLIDRYFCWSDASTAAALASEQQLVHIVDLRRARLPEPKVRKRVLEHAGTNLSAEVTLATVAVLDQPALRALIRAAVGLGRRPRPAPLLCVESIDAAIEVALRRLRSARIPPPMDLAPGSYRAPVMK